MDIELVEVIGPEGIERRPVDFLDATAGQSAMVPLLMGGEEMYRCVDGTIRIAQVKRSIE